MTISPQKNQIRKIYRPKIGTPQKNEKNHISKNKKSPMTEKLLWQNSPTRPLFVILFEIEIF
jgi:hypothetical protein